MEASAPTGNTSTDQLQLQLEQQRQKLEKAQAFFGRLSELLRELPELMALLNQPAADFDGWNQTVNKSDGSLSTGGIRLAVGDEIEIQQDELKKRTVTSVFGTPNNWQASFKGQGPVPKGNVLWRIISGQNTSALPTSQSS